MADCVSLPHPPQPSTQIWPASWGIVPWKYSLCLYPYLIYIIPVVSQVLKHHRQRMQIHTTTSIRRSFLWIPFFKLEIPNHQSLQSCSHKIGLWMVTEGSFHTWWFKTMSFVLTQATEESYERIGKCFYQMFRRSRFHVSDIKCICLNSH